MAFMSKQIALKWISENESRIIEISNRIWELAELGLVEFESSKLLADELELHGFGVERGVAGMPSAFVATYGSGKPVIGVLGQYDALPGLSQKTLPYKERLVEEGASGHGCGHNIYSASGTAAAIAVKEAIDGNGILGTVKFFGCPAEEIDIGKVFMVRDGVFDGVDSCLGHHPGQVNTADLRSSTATTQARFIFKGVASHAASSPADGRSALDAVELMNMGVNYMREHVIEKARIHYIIEDGGEVPNVVPPYARSWYFIRATEREQVASIYTWILDIAKGAALMTGTTHEVELVTAISNKIPNRTLSELVVKHMREIGAPEFTKEELEFASGIVKTIPLDKQRDILSGVHRYGLRRLNKLELVREITDPSGDGEVSPGSTDVSDISWNMPTIQFTTTCAVLGTPGHSWQGTAQYGMSIGHKGLIFGSKVLTASVIDLLTQPNLLKKAKEEWKDRMQDRVYNSPLPPDLEPPLEEAMLQAEISVRGRK
jgi:aminobenzoyl-glutamate utilization protein B